MSFFSFLSNPIALAAVTVAAIGAIVYQIYSQQNEERIHSNGRNNRRGGPGTHSSTSCRTIESGARRRKPYENSAKPTPGNDLKPSSVNDVKPSSVNDVKPSSVNDVKPNSKVIPDEKDTKKSNFNEEQYRQNVFDKIEKDVKNFNQRDENAKAFDKNIDVSEGNETDNSANLDETKVINLNVSNANVAHAQHGSSSSDARKENCQETKSPNSDLSITASSATGTSNQDMTSRMCRACEEVPANAVAYPCNHCYLCANCATMVFRIYKKCTICDSHVENFQILAI